MTEQTSAPEAPINNAVETLVHRLEHEHAWASELRDDLKTTESNIAKLLASIDSALALLPLSQRNHYRLQCARLGPKDARLGRPPRDARNAALLRYLSERGGEAVGSAELRLHLQKEGLQATSKYIHATLANWAAEGMITRVAHGCYMVTSGHPRLMSVRTRSVDSQIQETIARTKEERFQALAEEQAQRDKPTPEQIERRRRELYGPQRLDLE